MLQFMHSFTHIHQLLVDLHISFFTLIVSLFIVNISHRFICFNLIIFPFPSLFGLFQNLTYLGMYMFIPHYAIDTQFKHQYIRYQLIIFINICLRNPHTPRTNHSLYEFFRLQRLSHCFLYSLFSHDNYIRICGKLMLVLTHLEYSNPERDSKIRAHSLR